MSMIHRISPGERMMNAAGSRMTSFFRSRNLLYLFLFVALVFGGFAQEVFAAGVAPGGPGAASNWTPSNNTILGTAANTSSDVWFSGYNGIIGEVFYPTADTPNTTDLQFLVGDSGHSWVDEEKVATTSSVQLYNNHSLAWTVTNTASSGKYRITKTIYYRPDAQFAHPASHLHRVEWHALELPAVRAV